MKSGIDHNHGDNKYEHTSSIDFQRGWWIGYKIKYSNPNFNII